MTELEALTQEVQSLAAAVKAQNERLDRVWNAVEQVGRRLDAGLPLHAQGTVWFTKLPIHGMIGGEHG